MKSVLHICFLLLAVNAFSQKFTVSGYVKNIESGEILIGATVYQPDRFAGTSTNGHGFYSFTLKTDSIQLVYSFIGFQPQVLHFKLYRDTTIHVNLTPSSDLGEVVIRATKMDRPQESTKMSSVTFNSQQIKSIPALMGETDLLKVLQLLPGVQSGNEGTTGLYVRGGGADQNLILLDGVPVYNASHLFGFFSVFNSDAINRVELTKGGFPARFGGRLSSVIDINMKEGNMKELKVQGSVGLISAKVTVEGPIIKDKTSFILSARRTYLDVLAQPIIHLSKPGTSYGYYFYDVNFKVNHIINAKNRIYLSNYFGRDKAYNEVKETSGYDTTTIHSNFNTNLQWGNTITALRWDHVFTPKLFSNVAATYTNYHFSTYEDYTDHMTYPIKSEDYSHGSSLYTSGIKDWGAKIDLDFIPNPDHYIRFGGNTIFHTFTPGVLTYRLTQAVDSTAGAQITKAIESAAYVEDDWRIASKLKVNLGVHGSLFHVEGIGYHSVQPRLSANYLINENLSIKASYSSMAQFIHLLANAGLGLPTDLWVPSTTRIKPQSSNQVAVGLSKSLLDQLEISLEGYYKTMRNLIEYKDGASFDDVTDDWQNKVVAGGQGKSAGIEFLLQKKTGVITGWLGYTLSKTTRQFDNLNFGKAFPYKYDRRHDISLAVTRTWQKNKELGLVWVFGTGNAVTLPVAVYQGVPNNRDPSLFTDFLMYNGERNAYRMPSYHRLDLSYSWWKEKKNGQSKWTIAIYNVYNRANPFYVDYVRKSNLVAPKFYRYSLFPIIPSITYSFKMR